MDPVMQKPKSKKKLEPTWEIASLFPRQGQWSIEEYLNLPTNHLVEFTNGKVEILPMPSESHQLIIAFLYERLRDFVRVRALGLVLFAAMPVRLQNDKFREPDIMFLFAEHAHRRHRKYWDAPDLVMEVVSQTYRKHDLETKRVEYAQAGIPEYWIVDPETRTITVLTLDGETYAEAGIYGENETAASVLLPGLNVAVNEVWAAAEL